MLFRCCTNSAENTRTQQLLVAWGRSKLWCVAPSVLFIGWKIHLKGQPPSISWILNLDIIVVKNLSKLKRHICELNGHFLHPLRCLSLSSFAAKVLELRVCIQELLHLGLCEFATFRACSSWILNTFKLKIRAPLLDFDLISFELIVLSLFITCFVF